MAHIAIFARTAENKPLPADLAEVEREVEAAVHAGGTVAQVRQHALRLQTATPEPTATLDILPKGREKHRSDLIVLCNALRNMEQLHYEYYTAKNDWEPNHNDNDLSPELTDLGIFSNTLSALIDATYELPKTKVADAINYKSSRRQFFSNEQDTWRLLAEHYKTKSQTKYDLFLKRYSEDAPQLFKEYTEQWETIASDYQFDDWTCARTDGN